MARNHARLLDRPHLLREFDGPITAGNDFSISVPTRTHWELISCHIKFTTDANVADRVFRLEAGPFGQEDFAAIMNTKLTASTVYNMWFGRGFGYFNNTFNNGYLTSGWPAGLILGGGEQFRTVIVNIQAGDQINNIRFRFQQWHDPVIIP